MGDYDVDEGCHFLNNCLPYSKEFKKTRKTYSAQAVRAAISELSKINKSLFGRSRAPLERYYPHTYEYLFHKLQASQGPDAVHGIATFLARLDLLESCNDPSRESHYEDDKAAVELLAKRGVDVNERRRLQEFVEVALGPAEAISEVSLSNPEILRTRLIALRKWYDDWARTAKAVITKRSYLIRLGLAKRRNNKKTYEAK